MAKQPGTIIQRGAGVWQIQLNTGVKVNGKYQRVYKTVKGTKREAQAELRNMVNNLSAGVDLSGGKLAFDSFAAEWLEAKCKTLAPRTQRDYAQTVKTLIETLGNTPLEKVDARAIEKTLSEIEARLTKANGKAPSGSTLRKYYSALSLILGKAEAYDYIPKNPAKKVDPPKLAECKRRSMTPAQYANLLSCIEKATAEAVEKFNAKEGHLKETGHQNKARNELRGVHEYAYLIALRVMHATGARPSEVFALQWDCIDFANNALTIKQATETGDGGLKETKTKAGARTLDLDPATISALVDWRLFVSAAANKIGLEIGAKSFVVCTDAFTQASQHNFTHWWRKWSKANGFEGWQVYELRHTQATLLLANGLGVKDVQTRMGHSSAAVTLNNYAHATEEGQKRAATIMASLAKA